MPRGLSVDQPNLGAVKIAQTLGTLIPLFSVASPPILSNQSICLASRPPPERPAHCIHPLQKSQPPMQAIDRLIVDT